MSVESGTADIRTETRAGEQGAMTIGELAAITGLSVSAIRFYQRRGLLPARAVDGGWQRYGRDAVDRLAVIELAKGAGCTLDEIIRILDTLTEEPALDANGVPIWHGLAEAKIVEIDARIQRAQQLRRLLQDALAHERLSPERIAQVPAGLGWNTAPTGGHATPHPLPIPVAATAPVRGGRRD